MPTDAGSDATNLSFLIPALVLGASSVGAAISAWLLCYGRWRNGLRTLVATSAATTVVVGATVAACSTFSHGAATGIKFAVFPVTVALLFGVPVSILRLARFAVSKAFVRAKAYWRNISRDIGQVTVHRADPRGSTKNFQQTLLGRGNGFAFDMRNSVRTTRKDYLGFCHVGRSKT
jgi:hypothetical protein